MVKMLNIVEIGEQYLKIEIVKIVKMVNNVLNDQIRTMVVMVKMLTKTYKFKVIVKVNLIKVIWRFGTQSGLSITPNDINLNNQ